MAKKYKPTDFITKVTPSQNGYYLVYLGGGSPIDAIWNGKDWITPLSKTNINQWVKGWKKKS